MVFTSCEIILAPLGTNVALQGYQCDCSNNVHSQRFHRNRHIQKALLESRVFHHSQSPPPYLISGEVGWWDGERIDWLIFSTFQERWLPCEISLCESSNRFQFWNLTHNGYTWKISAASQASGWTQNQLQQWTSHQWMIKWCIGAEIWGNHDDFSCLKQENCWNSVAKSREKCKTDSREIQNAQDARNPLDLRQMRSGKWVATEVANGWRP